MKTVNEPSALSHVLCAWAALRKWIPILYSTEQSCGSFTVLCVTQRLEAPLLSQRLYSYYLNNRGVSFVSQKNIATLLKDVEDVFHIQMTPLVWFNPNGLSKDRCPWIIIGLGRRCSENCCSLSNTYAYRRDNQHCISIRHVLCKPALQMWLSFH